MEITTARLLLVEDDPLDQALILERLRTAPYLGVEITTATSLATAMSLLSEELFDLVLLDYRLPDGTAESLLEAIGTWEVSGIAPIALDSADALAPDVLMLSGLEDLRVAARTVRAGAVDFLSKRALENEELPRAVQAALVSRAHRTEQQRRAALEQQLYDYQVLVGHSERAATSLSYSVNLTDEQETTLRSHYREFLRSSVMMTSGRGITNETLTSYIYQQRIAVMHLIRIHTALIEELIDYEPVMAQRAVAQGRLALIRILLALVQRYQRSSEA